MKQKRNVYQLIKEKAQAIGKRCHPAKIILFGSYADGVPNKDSDIDLLVIFSRKGDRAKRYSEVVKALEPMPLPIDLLIRSTQDIKHRLKIGDSFIKKIMSEGKILYEC